MGNGWKRICCPSPEDSSLIDIQGIQGCDEAARNAAGIFRVVPKGSETLCIRVELIETAFLCSDPQGPCRILYDARNTIMAKARWIVGVVTIA